MHDYSSGLIALLSHLFPQYVSEKMGATEGTKLSADYSDMEQVSCGLVPADLPDAGRAENRGSDRTG